MSTPNDERRGTERRVIRTKVQLLVREGLLLEARTSNLNRGGMGIVTDGPLAPGLVLALHCHLPTAAERVELVAQARVVHSVYSSSDGGFAVGLVFVNLSTQAAATINSALSR